MIQKPDTDTPQLVITTFGNATIAFGEAAPVAVRLRKATALFLYLAVTRRAHSRDALAAMLWELPQDRARANLAVLLTELRQSFAPYLSITRQEVLFQTVLPHRIDCLELEAVVQPLLRAFNQDLALPRAALPPLDQALALYRSEFLEGLVLNESPEFEHWLLAERERYHQLVRDGYHALVTTAVAHHDDVRALAAARRLLALDASHEPTHRQLMLVLARNGQRTAAMEQFVRCREVLFAELGLDLEPATIELAEQIRTGDFPPGALISDGTAPATTPTLPLVPASSEAAQQPVSTLPAPNAEPLAAPTQSKPTPLLGRDADLVQIGARLRDSNCRVLTLLGPGGIGKTRLALETMQRFAELFRDGTVFIDLAPITSATFLNSAIAAALGLCLRDAADLEGALLDFLRGRNLLLVFDNIEHLLSGIMIIDAIAAAAPHVTILVTSRVRLDLRVEWIYDVRSLATPPFNSSYLADDDPRFRRKLPLLGVLRTYPAVELFLQRAHQIQPQLDLSAETLASVLLICELVAGIPLALELAASWVRTLPVREIAATISSSLDLLSTSQRDVPLRQRSMRAVFDHSWHLLLLEERQALKRLAVFRGSFDVPAAAAIIGDRDTVHALATRRVLRALVDCSLMQMHAPGRFRSHALVREYAEEQLAIDAAELHLIRTRHSRYFAAWLERSVAALYGPAQATAMQAITAESDNIRAAWGWAVAQADSSVFIQMHEGLAMWCDLCNLFREGQQLLAAAIKCVATQPEATLLHALLQAQYARFCERVADYEQGNAALVDALPILRRGASAPQLCLALIIAGRIQEGQGRWIDACELHEEAANLAHAHNLLWLHGRALHNLCSVLESASRLAEALVVSQESITLLRTVGDSRLLALALNLRGILLERSEQYDSAAECYRESLLRFTTLNDEWGIALVEGNLGNMAARRGDITGAWQHYQRATQLLYQVWSIAQLLTVAVKCASLSLKIGQAELALTFVSLPLEHAALPAHFRARAEAINAAVHAKLPAATYASLKTRCSQCTIDDLVDLVSQMQSFGQRREPARRNVYRVPGRPGACAGRGRRRRSGWRPRRAAPARGNPPGS